MTDERVNDDFKDDYQVNGQYKIEQVNTVDSVPTALEPTFGSPSNWPLWTKVSKTIATITPVIDSRRSLSLLKCHCLQLSVV